MPDLRGLLVTRGIFQTELAREMGVSQSYVASVVSGVAAPSERFCELAAAALGVTPGAVRDAAPAKRLPVGAEGRIVRTRARRALMLRGLRTGDVAVAAGCSDSYVNKVLRGVLQPPEAIVAAVERLTDSPRVELWPELFGGIVEGDGGEA